MNKRSARSFDSWRGSTLVEVIAGLGLLGTLLVALVLARSRLLEQNALAQKKMDAAAVAERLLASWWTSGEPMPREERGEADGHRWQTRVVSNDALRACDGEILRLELLAQTPALSGDPLVAVEIALPRPEADAKDSNATGVRTGVVR